MKQINNNFYNPNVKITREELIGLFTFAKNHGKTPDDLADIAHSMGYESRTHILSKDIPEIEKRLMSNDD